MHPGRWRISAPKVVFGPRHRWWVMAAALVLTMWVAWFAASTPRAVSLRCAEMTCDVLVERFGSRSSVELTPDEACLRMNRIFGKRSSYSREACGALSARAPSTPTWSKSYDTGGTAWGIALFLLMVLPLGGWAYAMRTVSVAIVGDNVEIRRRVGER